MAEEKPIASESDFPSPSLPTVFADGVMNVSNNAHVAKFYLYRTEPSLSGKNQYQAQVFAQVVMPIDAFVHAAGFFNSMVDYWVEKKLLTPERAAELRAMGAKKP